MNKVTVEITKEGWKTTAEIDGQTATEKHVKTKNGSTTDGELFEDNELIDEDMLEALESINSGAYDVMKELNMYLG